MILLLSSKLWVLLIVAVMRFEPVLIVTILTVVHVFVLGTEPPMCQTIDFHVLVLFFILLVKLHLIDNNTLPCDFQSEKMEKIVFLE